ncbi:MAG: lipoyl(octanoyl) transferase LipB [Steroidobacteraceae bacterium]
MYPLIDVRRAGLGVRGLVGALEGAVIDYAAGFRIAAACRAGAPGVYVAGRKLASVGIRIRRNGNYHGLALNVAMDLAPFGRINPCGYAGLEMTDLARLGRPADLETVAGGLAPLLLARASTRAPVPPRGPASRRGCRAGRRTARRCAPARSPDGGQG